MKSKWILSCLVLLMIVTRLLILPSKILTWDTFGYYLYLPSTFIYDDLKLKNDKWLNDLYNEYEPSDTKYQINIVNKNNVIMYTSGSSILYSPFFFLAHAYAKNSSYKADGLSPPYQYIITAGGMLFLFIGLFFLSKILLVYFSETVSSLTLLLIVIGTNFLQFTCLDGTLLTHSHLFTLYAILIWYTIQWHKLYKLKDAIIIGICLGMIALVRPSELVAVFIPVLWNIRKSFPVMISKFHHLIIAIFLAACVGSIQFFYWKYTTGEYIINSYDVSGAKLDLLKSNVLNILFSFRKGWFIYTPLMFFAFTGFYFLYNKNKVIFWPLFVFISLHIYIVSCWSVWWYAGGSFSPRPFVAVYAILAIPLAYFIEFILSKSKALKLFFIAIAVVVVTLNLFQSWQFEKNIIDRERMTMNYYLAIFGKTKAQPEYEKLKLIDRTLTKIADSPFYTEYDHKLINSYSFDEESHGVLELNKSSKFKEALNQPYGSLTSKDHLWIKSSVQVIVDANFRPNDSELVSTIQSEGKNYKYRTTKLKHDKLIPNEWNELSMEYLTPEIHSNSAQVKVYLWYRGQDTLQVDNLRTELYFLP